MEVVDTLFTRRRITAAVVQPRTDAALHLLDDAVVLMLDVVESAARSLHLAGRVHYPGPVHDARAIDGERDDDVEGQPPRIEVQHRIGEEEEIVRGDGR